jgi:predicted porin
MKRALTLLTLSTACLTAAWAQSSVQLYGRVNTTVEFMKNYESASNTTKMNNNASRWGLKGTEDLGDGLKASFLLESGFDSDTGRSTQAGSMFGREAWLGLEGGFGRVRLGNMGATAMYYATADYISMHNHDTGISADAFYLYPGSSSNTIAYNTPSMGGLVLEVQYGLKERTPLTPDVKDTFVVAANYDNGPLHLGAGFVRGPASGLGLVTQKATQVGLRAAYDMGPVTLGAYYIYDQWKDVTGAFVADNLKRHTARLAAMYTVGQSEFHANVGWASKIKLNTGTQDGTDSIQYTIGYNYNLSKRTKIYSYYTGLSNKENADYMAFDSGRDPRSFAIGVRHNF